MPEMEIMEKRIDLEKRGRQAEEITELNLDNCRSTQIHGLTDEFINLEILSLINVGLTSLKGFPCLPNLKKLELSDNRLTSGLDNLCGCSTLSYLNLSGNKFKDIESLEPLKSLEKLRNLDLFNCEVTNVEDYRTKVFEALPNLVFLDGFDQNDVEADEEEYEDQEASGDEENGVDDEEDLSEDGDEDVSSDHNISLSYLQKSTLEEESEGEDFEPGEEDDEESDEEDEAEEGDESLNTSGQVIEGGRGVKRKHSEEETK